MKTIEQSDATATLAEYAAGLASGPVIVTRGGQPVAALVPLVNADLETVSLSANQQFLNLIERSRRSAQSGGGIPANEMRRRFPEAIPDRARDFPQEC